MRNLSDLIARRKDINPLILIVFILPDDENKWVEFDPCFLTVRKQAFWYLPSLSESETDNTSSITINILEKNLIDFNTFPQLFDYIYNLPTQ